MWCVVYGVRCVVCGVRYAAWCGVVWFGVVWCGVCVKWCGVLGVEWWCAVWCAVRCGVMWYGVAWCVRVRCTGCGVWYAG